MTIDQANTDYPTEFFEKKNSSYYPQNIGYSIATKEHISKISDLHAEITTIENGILNPQHPNQSIEDRKSDFAVWYPNIHEFLLDKSQKVLVQGYPSFGKYINPYIFWACLKDQFQNARLKEIIYHQPSINKITITPNNQRSVIQDILRPLSNEIKNQTFRSFVDQFSKHLKQMEDENGDLFQNEYVFNEKGLLSNRLMKDQPGFTRDILGEVVSIKIGKEISLLKREYILSCLSTIQDGGAYQEIKIREAYRRLLELRNRFVNWYQSKVIKEKEKLLIPNKAYLEMPDNLFHEVVEVYTLLKENDILISSSVISFLQKFNGELSDKTRERVFKELEGLFINVTDQRVENKKFYVLEENYIAEIQNSFSIPLI